MQMTAAASLGATALFRGVQAGKAAVMGPQVMEWSRTQVEEMAGCQGIAYVLRLHGSMNLEHDLAYCLYRQFVEGFLRGFADECALPVSALPLLN